MALTSATLATIAVGVSAAGTGYQIYQGQRAQRAQERAAEVQRRQRDAEAARQRKQQIAEARRRRAAIENTAAQTGTEGSSGELGATGNLQTQLGESTGFAARGARRASIFESFQQKANRASTQAQIGGAVAGIASSAGGLFSSPGSPPQGPRRAGGQSMAPQSSGFIPANTPGRSIF